MVGWGSSLLCRKEKTASLSQLKNTWNSIAPGRVSASVQSKSLCRSPQGLARLLRWLWFLLLGGYAPISPKGEDDFLHSV